jgi:prolyl 4-hydroxylase
MITIATLRESARAGDAQAQLTLAQAAILRLRDAPSVDEAGALLEASCAQDFAPALLFKSVLTARGLGRAKSASGAYALEKRAAALGHSEAQAMLRILGADALDMTPWRKTIELEPLADAPRMFSIKGFLPETVCDWLIAAAKTRLTRAVVNLPDSATTISKGRTNSSAGFAHLEGDLVMQLVSRRIGRATGTDLSQHEPLNVLHYAPGEEYRPHYDVITPWGPDGHAFASEAQAHGLRMATVLVYLNAGYEGGETVFPRLNLQYKGERGDALIFWSVSERGAPERDSLHAGTPVLSGEKWLLSQWIRQRPVPLT